jgi:hypothetical protein
MRLKPKKPSKAPAAPRDDTPAPPRDLGATGKTLWLRLAKAYRIDDANGVVILDAACRAADYVAICRSAVARDGLMIRGRYGVQRAHPLLAEEARARTQLLSALRQLQLPIPEEA